MTKLSLLRFDSRAELDAALAVRLRAALTAHGASAVMLAGGSTPLPAYRAIARQMGAHDDRLHILFSDDRYVAADAAASNYFQSRPLLDVLALSRNLCCAWIRACRWCRLHRTTRTSCHGC